MGSQIAAHFANVGVPALLLDVTAPIAFYAARGEQKRWLRRGCYALSVMMMITVLFTLSRGGFLGLCVIALGLAAKSRYKVTGLLAVVLIGSITFAVLPGRIAERVGTIRTASEADQSAQMRFDSWWVSLQIIGDHPLLGVGPRNMLGLYSRYLQTENIRVAHNSFLQMAVDAGLPALLLFLGVIVLSFVRLRRARAVLKARAPDSPLIAYSHGLEIALLAYIVSGNFLSRHDLELVYEVFALATSFGLLGRDLQRQAETSGAVEGEPRTFLAEPAVAARATLNNPS